MKKFILNVLDKIKSLRTTLFDNLKKIPTGNSWFKQITGIMLAGIVTFCITIYFFTIENVEERNQRVLSVARNASKVTYQWLSDYTFYVHYPRNVSISNRAQALNGILYLKNNGTKPVTNFSADIYYGFDEKIYTRPYGRASMLHLTTAKVAYSEGIVPDSTVAIFLLKELRNEIGNLTFLFSGKEDKYLFKKDSLSQYAKLMPNTSFPYNIPDGKLSFSKYEFEDVKFPLYFRIYIRYKSDGLEYNHILSGIIGHGYIYQGSDKGMVVYDNFYKLAMSKINYQFQDYVMPFNQTVTHNRRLNKGLIKKLGCSCGITEDFKYLTIDCCHPDVQWPFIFSRCARKDFFYLKKFKATSAY